MVSDLCQHARAWSQSPSSSHAGEHHPTDYLSERIDKETKIAKQLGTLGGGNHFLEVVYSEGDEQVSRRAMGEGAPIPVGKPARSKSFVS